MIDRVAQFKPLQDLLVQMLTARQDSDISMAALNDNLTTVADLNRQYSALQSKFVPWGGATQADFGAMFQLLGRMSTEGAKTGALQHTATDDMAAFNSLWMQANLACQQLLQNPGASEVA